MPVAAVSPRTVALPDRDRGQRSRVLAIGQGRFRLATIEVGPIGDDGATQVLDGLHPGQRIVLSGQFLLDSESQLREAVAKLLAARKGTANPDSPGVVQTRPATRPASGSMSEGQQ